MILELSDVPERNYLQQSFLRTKMDLNIFHKKLPMLFSAIMLICLLFV